MLGVFNFFYFVIDWNYWFVNRKLFSVELFGGRNEIGFWVGSGCCCCFWKCFNYRWEIWLWFDYDFVKVVELWVIVDFNGDVEDCIVVVLYWLIESFENCVWRYWDVIDRYIECCFCDFNMIGEFIWLNLKYSIRFGREFDEFVEVIWVCDCLYRIIVIDFW